MKFVALNYLTNFFQQKCDFCGHYPTSHRLMGSQVVNTKQTEEVITASTSTVTKEAPQPQSKPQPKIVQKHADPGIFMAKV